MSQRKPPYRLNVGCGRNTREDWVNVDAAALPGVDIVCDLENLRAHPIDLPDDSVEQVLLSHVIEHLDRDTGWAALPKLERIARRLVYVETPTGFLAQPAMSGNRWQRHLSGWFPHDFESRGYNVYGDGPRFLLGPMGHSRFLPSTLARLLPRLLQFYCFRHPASAYSIGAIRYMDAEGNLRNV